MKLIVDTNIVFSGLLNQQSRIGKILLNHHKLFNLYSCNYLNEELNTHLPKLCEITGKTISELKETKKLITKNILFINESIIPQQIILESEELVKDVDSDDIMYIALTKHLNGKLWTGDKKLIKGLLKNGFDQIITTQELLQLIEKLESEE